MNPSTPMPSETLQHPMPFHQQGPSMLKPVPTPLPMESPRPMRHQPLNRMPSVLRFGFWVKCVRGCNRAVAQLVVLGGQAWQASVVTVRRRSDQRAA